MKKSQTILVLLLIATALGGFAWVLYSIFFIKNLGWVEVLALVSLAIIVFIVLITTTISRLSKKFPNSKLVKFFEESWQRISEMLDDALHGL